MKINLFEFCEKLKLELESYGVEFSDDGYPIFTEDMLLKKMPQYVTPIGHTYGALDKSKTLLVLFSNDENIYKRLENLNKDIPKYKEYLGVAGFDLSPRINWDIKLQKFNILINMMVGAYLAVHGVKIMPNFRIGCLETVDVLTHYPKHSWFAVGALGCAKGHVKLNKMYLSTKIIITNPDMLIYYGILRPEYENILKEMNIPYRVFADFQRVSRERGQRNV